MVEGSFSGLFGRVISYRGEYSIVLIQQLLYFYPVRKNTCYRFSEEIVDGGHDMSLNGIVGGLGDGQV